MKIGLYLVTLG